MLKLGNFEEENKKLHLLGNKQTIKQTKHKNKNKTKNQNKQTKTNRNKTKYTHTNKTKQNRNKKQKQNKTETKNTSKQTNNFPRLNFHAPLKKKVKLWCTSCFGMPSVLVEAQIQLLKILTVYTCNMIVTHDYPGRMTR